MDKQVFNYSLKLLSARPYTEQDLRKKLIRRFDEGDDEIDEVIIALKKANFVNDEEYVRSYLRYEADTNLRGKFGYYQKLYQKGIKKDLFEKVWTEFDFDQLEMAKKLLNQNKFRFEVEKDQTKKRQKIQRYLKGRGFDFDIIMKC